MLQHCTAHLPLLNTNYVASILCYDASCACIKQKPLSTSTVLNSASDDELHTTASAAPTATAFFAEGRLPAHAGTEVYVNRPERWHVTIFHTSKFEDTRPNPMKPAGSDLLAAPAAQRPLPSPDQLQQEHRKMEEVAKQSPALHLQVLPACLPCLHSKLWCVR